MNQPRGHCIDALVELMARLRAPEGGCPWDLQQDFTSVAPYTLEEAYEVVEAIEQGDLPALRGELGDLLFQVVFHARMAEELGAFTFRDVVEGIVEKMVRRHPHVFGDSVVVDSVQQTIAWEAEKQRERAKGGHAAVQGLMGGVTQGLPALVRAEKLQRRAARLGLDSGGGVAEQIQRIRGHLDELESSIAEPNPDTVAQQLGCTLFETAALARQLGVDAEQQLRVANQQLITDVAVLEARLACDGLSIESIDQAVLRAVWRVIRGESTPAGS